MRDRKLATNYARALLSTISDPATAESVDSFLRGVGQAMDDSPDLRDALVDPAVPRDVRLDLLTDLAGRYAMPEQVNQFLGAVVEHGRIAALPEIAEMYTELREKQQGIVPVTVTTAVPLGEELRRRTRAALEKLTGKVVRLECRVEPDLLGGAVAQIGSKVYDGSLRTQLGALRRRMAEE
jgi:F-type H+-transporting ATPase subunit delta